MAFTSWLRKRKTAGHHQRAARFRLQFESLETRTFLSVAQPNIVFIMTDDQEVGTMQYMPRVQELLADQGVTFNNSFVTSSICCPSNVTALTGQYTFNHGILNNGLPTGGFQKFVNMRTDGDPATQGDESTLAVWLDDAGYNTARVGKYLVGYPDNSTYVPPGWDEWYNAYGGFTSYFGYRVNENGTVVQYGTKAEDYITDVFTAKAVDFINRAEENDDQPFFLTFTPTAPHSGSLPNGPATPAPRHVGMFAGVQAPRTPSFNEADVSDKPPGIANRPLLTAAQIAAIDHEYRTRIESLQAVDEGIGVIIDTLAANGELENTYIIFTSDNGYHLGQHRSLNGKFEVYEEDIRVPLIIRGPGVEAGVTRDQMAVNIDLAPTMAQWGEATPDRVMDGKSLALLLGPDGATQNWRTDFLVELYRHLPPMQNGDVIKAVRTEHELYVEYQSGPRELYDLDSDPDQLENIYATADPAHIAQLSARLAELATSQGDPSYLPGDYNGNGAVEQADLDLVLLHWGQAAATVPPTWIGPQPTGPVDQNELDAVLLNWGAMSAASAADEWMNDLPTGLVDHLEHDAVLADWGTSSPVASLGPDPLPLQSRAFALGSSESVVSHLPGYLPRLHFAQTAAGKDAVFASLRGEKRERTREGLNTSPISPGLLLVTARAQARSQAAALFAAREPAQAKRAATELSVSYLSSIPRRPRTAIPTSSPLEVESPVSEHSIGRTLNE